MGSRRCVIAAVLCMVASCSSSSPPPAPRSCKPEAPVDVLFDAVADGAGGVALSLRAAPTRVVESIELALIAPDGRRLRGTAGEATLERTVAHDGSSAVVAGIATVVVDGVTMSKTVERAIGPPRPQPRTRTYALPDGERAREVRP